MIVVIKHVPQEGPGSIVEFFNDIKTIELSKGEALPADISDIQAVFSMGGQKLYRRVIDSVERKLIESVLEKTQGNQIRAAEILGINRNTLRTKIRKLGIEVYR